MPPGRDASKLPLVGNWLVEATVPGGGRYAGTIGVRPVGETVELSWDTTAGRYFGIGLEEGGAWYVACGEDAAGLGLALVSREGKLRWSPAPNRGTVGSAVLSPAFARRGSPVWEADPDSPAGSPFTALVLEGGGEVREAGLRGGPVARGLALPTAAGWAIAWYPRFDQTVILRYLPGRRRGTWEAVWALGGRLELAGELLRPARR
jgi:hypothetical protein